MTGKNQFYIKLHIQNELKLTCSSVEFQKFSRSDTPGPSLQGQGKGGMERGRGKKYGKRRKGIEEGGGRGRRVEIAIPLFWLKSCTGTH